MIACENAIIACRGADCCTAAMPECRDFPAAVPMPSPATTPPTPRSKPILGLSPRAWLYITIAFAAGLLLFLLIWMRQRGADDFYRADSSVRSATGSQFEPLPGPDMDAARS